MKDHKEEQCHGCALKVGAAANREPSNHLTAILCALGAGPFYCHATTPDGDFDACTPDIAIEAIRSGEMLHCGGWVRFTRRLKAAGWFTDPDLRFIRQVYAQQALQDINEIKGGIDDPEHKDQVFDRLRQTFDVLIEELRALDPALAADLIAKRDKEPPCAGIQG